MSAQPRTSATVDATARANAVVEPGAHDPIERQAPIGPWVAESRFGLWFQRTGIWQRYVVAEALAILRRLAPADAARGGTILDAGCGEGAAFGLLQREFAPARIIAIDIDPQAVVAARATATTLARASARTTAPSCAAPAAIDVQRADACALPLRSGSVDLVLCHQLLHHTDDPRATLAELARVLAPGGWLLLSESCRSFLEWWPVRALFRHPPRRPSSAEEYLEQLRRAGLSLHEERITQASPWWSRRDLGLGERWFGTPPSDEPTQLHVAARVPPIATLR